MKRGFTLIELLIVIAIIVALAGALIPMFSTTKVTAQQAKVQADLDAVKSAAVMCHYDTGSWPVAGTAGAGLINSGGIANWSGPYVDRYATDPWGNPYRIIDGTAAPVTITAACYGSDNAVGGAGAATDFTLLIAPDRSK